MAVPSDWATKLVLRVCYSLLFAFGLAFVVLPRDQIFKLVPAVEGMTAHQLKTVGGMQIGQGALLAAAAQSDFYAQKKALQYNMVSSILSVLITAFHAGELGRDAYATTALSTVVMGLSLWLVVFFLRVRVVVVIVVWRAPALAQRQQRGGLTACRDAKCRACYYWKEIEDLEYDDDDDEDEDEE